MMIPVDDAFPESLDRAAAVCAVVWPQGKGLSNAWRHSEW